ncbi:MAG TPA: tetratricopeptide repeat protein, partial [Vicinamibacterales bacterium]|nr:tetratricopeptide repeat protein [Vicinamibacterales bacterium]
LANLSGDPAQEFFADGMTEALIADLAKISSLKVISRTSVMRYRGTTRSLPEIARELGVDAVIEGSVQRSQDRIRITAQLIDASSDRHLWADSYDRSAQDVLALQSEVARAIATQVRARVSPEEAARLQNARTVKPDAYEAYLLGRHHIARRNPESLERALESFQKATELDPTFALGWAGLSGAYIERDVWAGLGVGRLADAARAAALEAIRLEPDLADAHRALAAVRFQYDWDWPGTEASYLKAIELNPSLADAYTGYAYYLTAMGRFDESIANARRAAELDPLSPVLVGSYGRALYRARRYEDALARYKRALEIDPEDRPSLSRIAEAYIELGKYQEALSFADRLEKVGLAPAAARARGRIYAAMGRTSEALAEIERIKRDNTAGDRAVTYAAIYAQLGCADEAIAALEQGVEAHFRREPGAMQPFVPMDPVFDPIRGHPRFVAMLERAKLPRYPLPVRQ